MSHINMGGMNGTAATMGQMPMLNGTTPGRVDDQEQSDYPARLNAYIYDYFLGQGMWECARAMVKHRENMEPAPSDDQVNGIDSKDSIDSKKPHDLPSIQIGTSQPGAFLLEWFDVFWDIFQAQRSKPKGGPQTSAQRYIEHNTAAQKFRQEQQAAMLRQGAMNPMEYQQMLRPNGMQPNGDLRKQMLQAKGMNMGLTPQQMAQYSMGNQAMRRDPSAMDMDGQRPRTPSSGDNAPSPSKRPRLEGGPPGFNGRGGMPPNMIDARAAAHQNMLKNGMDPGQVGQEYQNMHSMHSMRQAMINSGMRGQGSPMMGNGMDFGGPGFPGDPRMNGPNGNHALQDYQMQLMLLEQQNKKRLLMARQEQSSENRPDGQGGPGYPSPNGSRSGPSPGPSEQMGKRGSPQMGSGQSPLPNGVIPHDRPSPNSMSFVGQQMPQEMMQAKMENGMPQMGPGGAMTRGPQGQFNPQAQAAEMQARMRQAGQMPNGPNMFQPQQPPQAPMMQQSQSQQPAQMGTPRGANAMPPPQNPAVANANNGRTASPAPSAAPPTPQQSNKAAPKKKKAAENKSKPTKKGSTAGAPAQTPSAETDAQPPTPTPATPITPQHPSSFSGVKNEAPASAPAANAVPPAAPQSVPPPMEGLFDPLSSMDTSGYPLEYAPLDDPNNIISSDFNFDSFLNPDAEDYGMDPMNFASTLMADGGVEAGGVDNP